jgi:hypothetical protein
MSCKWYNICPMRRLEKQGKISDYWKENFCLTEDNWKNCRRYQMEENAQPHPDNMLPDGRIDETLE